MTAFFKNRPPVSEETRVKMSVASKGRALSDEAKDKIRQKAIGRVPSANAIENMSKAQLGRKHEPRSEEWKIKQRASHFGRKDPPTGFANRSKVLSGAKNPRAKEWALETEKGEVFRVQSLKTWCRENSVHEHYLKTRTTFTSGYRLLKNV
jgi:hypothetical protein